MTTVPCQQLTTADIFAAVIEEINKADILSKILPFDLIPNIKKYTLLNVLKEFERVLAVIRKEFWYGIDELLFKLLFIVVIFPIFPCCPSIESYHINLIYIYI
jgi:hypothetical protein